MSTSMEVGSQERSQSTEAEMSDVWQNYWMSNLK